MNISEPTQSLMCDKTEIAVTPDTLSPPTVRLPPVKSIPFLPLDTLEESLRYLRVVYNPPVRGSHLISCHKVFPPSQSPHSIVLAPPDEYSSLDLIRSDKYERSYALRWLTSLISQIQFGDAVDPPMDDDDCTARESLIANAASLLAICAGTASAGRFTRVFAFGHDSINVQITDISLENRDYNTLGAQTWGGACVLAETILDNPHGFWLSGTPSRVLELGAGTGLVSIALARYLSIRGSVASIYPTDFNSTVLTNLNNNIVANIDSLSSSVTLTSAFFDWSQPANREPRLSGTFDLILGADIVYEMQHISWIKFCVETLLRVPQDPERHPQFHLVVPLRLTHTLECSTIELAFPFAQTTPPPDDALNLVIVSKDVIVCDADGDKKSEEVEYVYYIIGWQGGSTVNIPSDQAFLPADV